MRQLFFWLYILEFTLKYSGTPPYVQLVITATFFCPGESPIHFLIKKKPLTQPLR